MVDFVQFSQKSMFIPFWVDFISSCSSSSSRTASTFANLLMFVTELHNYYCVYILALLLFFQMLMFMLLHCFLCEVCCSRCVSPTNWLQFYFYFYSGFCSFLDASKIRRNEKLLHVIIFALLTLCMQVATLANGKWCTCLNSVCVCEWASATERESEVVERTMEYVNRSTNKTRSVNIKPSSHFSCTLCIHRKPYLLIHNLFAFVPILQMEHAQRTHTHAICSTRLHLRWFSRRLIQHRRVIYFRAFDNFIGVFVLCAHFTAAQQRTAPNAMLAHPCCILCH